ncbi:MAG: 4-hydroxythreonine-4-phosphate dehydrogenase PdxA [Fretibacterium sp.]|nr:4-hydroxythreonine-4-phosphate dehydrogenase PdxA [Fretibacterium sp.]
MKKPIIAIPIGDPAGVGPEIVVKALASDTVKGCARCLVVGDRKIVERANTLTGAGLTIHLCPKPEETDFSEGVLNLIDLDNVDMASFEYGKVQAMCGRAAYGYIERSIGLAMNGKADAVATTPINKEALHAANIPYIGHTEIFGALTGTKNPLTMFETNAPGGVSGLRVFFLTRHLSLLQMLGQITKNNIVACARECFAALERLGVTSGTMAVAALNPHGGEHGLFGWEEVNEIAPAVEQLRAEGYNVAGPIGADSVFHQAARGFFTSVLSLYHDQGHIATKTLDFERTISITNGMPILRTSVDHGTAFDIAGKNRVSEVSMVEAIRLAALYAPCFTSGRGR